MTTDTTLQGRLLAHAEAHASVSPYDDEQAQWERDLREAAAALAVRGDFVMVPKETTGAMDDAGVEASSVEGFERQDAERIFLAMISAAPQPQEEANNGEV